MRKLLSLILLVLSVSYNYCEQNPFSTRHQRVEKVPMESMVDQGCVGYWRFNEGAGVIAKNEANAVSSGTLIGGIAWATGKFGSCLYEDGINDYVEILASSVTYPTYNFDANTSFSYSMWVYVVSSSTTWDTPLWKGGSNISTPGFDIELGNPVWAATLSDGTQTKSVSFTRDDITNRWVSLTCVVDRSSGAFIAYIDGVRSNTTNSATNITGFGSCSGMSNLRIGRQAIYWFRGYIDEVKIYNRALTDMEVSSHYSKGVIKRAKQ